MVKIIITDYFKFLALMILFPIQISLYLLEEIIGRRFEILHSNSIEHGEFD